MNSNSRICSFIKNNENWAEELGNLCITVREDYPLAIFNYGLEADFTNPIVREARGIIINLETLEVVCWPFSKFCNLHEEGAKEDVENFDWDSCSCQEKVDGSIVKLWFNNLTGEWQWSTNSIICAKDAPLLEGAGNFDTLIKGAVNYKDINYQDLDKDITYIFELVSPLSMLVIQYKENCLYHIGSRNRVTGEELDIDIGIKKPERYDLHTLDDCLNACFKLNQEGVVKKEGFVLVDKYYHRIKLKSPEYLAKHILIDVGKLSKRKVISIIRDGIATVEELVERTPSREVFYRYYAFKMVELEWNINRYLAYVRGLYEELGHDRSAVAKVIKKDKYVQFGFQGIGNTLSASDMLKGMGNNQYAKLIDDYVVSQFKR